MGYRPNPLFSTIASRIVAKKLNDVPLAYLDSVYPGEKNPGTTYFAHALRRANELGYRLERINLANWKDPENIWKILYARGFAGILLGRTHPKHLQILLQNDVFPVVCCGRIHPLPFHTVRPAITEAIHRLWTKLTQMGYHKIGAAIFRHNVPIEDDFCRHAAVLCCQREVNGQDLPIPPFTGDFKDFKGLIAWIKTHNPEVVIGFGIGTYYALIRAGYRIPEDIGWVGLHRQPADPEWLSALDQNDSVVGEFALNLIDQMIRHGERGVPLHPLNVSVQPSWVEGQTVIEQTRK